MKLHPILIYAGALIAAVSLALGGRELALHFGRDATALDLAAPVLAVATALLCIAVLDWARNLPRHGGTAAGPAGEGAAAPQAARPAVQASAGERGLVDAIHALDALASGDRALDKITEEATNVVAAFSRASHVAVWLADGAGAFRLRADFADGHVVVREGVAADPADQEELEQLVECRKPLEARDDEAARFLFPLINGEQCFGALRITVPSAALGEGGDVAAGWSSSLALLAGQFARTLMAPEAYERAVLDRLTGGYSRRHLMSRLAEATSFCRRYGEPMSLILLDLDNFGLLNGTFGAGAADRVLHAVAALVKQNVRESDSVYRYRADELAVLLPNAEGDRALTVAERLRRVVRESRTLDDAGNAIIASVSVGVSEFDEDMRGVEPLLARAEEALRAARDGGRDRVRAWRPPSEPAREATSG